jgi:hypothetical protein
MTVEGIPHRPAAIAALSAPSSFEDIVHEVCPSERTARELDYQTHVLYFRAAAGPHRSPSPSMAAASRRGAAAEDPLVERVQEPIEVLTKFVEGKILPLRFRWRGRVFTIERVTGAWSKRVGDHRVHFFSVGVGTRDFYEISYQARTSRWTLENVYLEG